MARGEEDIDRDSVGRHRYLGSWNLKPSGTGGSWIGNRVAKGRGMGAWRNWILTVGIKGNSESGLQRLGEKVRNNEGREARHDSM